MKSLFILVSSILLSMGLNATTTKQISIVPQPEKVVIKKGRAFNAKGQNFYASSDFDKDSKKHIEDFAAQLSLVSGKISTCDTSSPAGTITPSKGFVFVKDNTIKDEAYSIVSSSSMLEVRASTANGVLYAIQSIKQMLPAEIFGNKENLKLDWKIPAVEIRDTPRFGYRGFMLDVSRHFFPVEEIKKYLDFMSIYKMNRFHWHLSEDQGWRIEIKKYPKLTEVGAYRNGTMIEKDFNSNDGIRYGGFYTQDQIREVVDYAASKGITIIPEIDLPGHMLAALSSYPELGCTGGPYSVWSRWGVSNDVLCIGKPKTLEFLKDVLAEVIELFPSEYIHIGGDECPKVNWKKCPDCQKLISELGLVDKPEHSKEVALQNYVTTEIQKFINSKGRKIIGWDEILEGELAPGATVMSWRGVKGGIQAAQMGYNAIMSPNTYLYFDYYQGPRETEPLAIGGNSPIEKVYSYKPLEGMPENVHKHILGIQANLWTEYIATASYLEYMTAPRAAALSEIQWTSEKNKNFDRFRESMKKHRQIYDIIGFNYAKHLWK